MEEEERVLLKEVIGASGRRHGRGQLQLRKVWCAEAAAGVRGESTAAAELPGRQNLTRGLQAQAETLLRCGGGGWKRGRAGRLAGQVR